MKTKSILFGLLGLVLASCQNQEAKTSSTDTENTIAETMTINDPHTFAKPQDARVKHLSWKANVNFDQKQIEALATWTIESSDSVDEIFFDAYGLNVSSVKVDGTPVNFIISKSFGDMGAALKIPIESTSKVIEIDYTTTEEARALQWLDPEQTADKTMPFLFTQSQAILARSWVPTQDGPGIRFTYDAEVTVPKGMIALMSASNPSEKSEDGVYHFDMPQPIPSYLLALAVGDVYFEAVSERTGVYAEKSMLEKSVNEFADLEKMVQAAEELYGPYAWGRYDLIVLPPSFPFGGMENPRLTFATPTILAGDRSLVSLVAHELAHSWSGNLVTNANWNDFWLNEGFTVYFEHRIMEAVYGKEYSEMLASLTRDELIEAADDMLKTVPNDTKLKLELEGRNPDDGVTSIPYNKGYFFLRLIEETVGREAFDKFLKDYFETYKFKVMTTEAFVDHLGNNLLSKEQMQTIGVNKWIYETGIPENLPVVNSNRFELVENALTSFMADGTLPQENNTSAWTTHEWLHFIHSIPSDVSVEQLSALDAAYNFSKTGNSEIAAAWFQPTIRNNYEPVYAKVEEFLISVGRRKFLTPTYRAMLESDKKEMALDIYTKARPNYHSVSRQTMDELLGWEENI